MVLFKVPNITIDIGDAGLVISINYYLDQRHIARTLKGSRRNIGISEVSLLRKISAPIECPNCDGIINLENVSEDMVYTCQYCGANGIIDIKLQE
jgi:hypothetical protein